MTDSFTADTHQGDLRGPVVYLAYAIQDRITWFPAIASECIPPTVDQPSAQWVLSDHDGDEHIRMDYEVIAFDGDDFHWLQNAKGGMSEWRENELICNIGIASSGATGGISEGEPLTNWRKRALVPPSYGGSPGTR